MTAGNQHSENNNEQNKATIKQKTNKNKMLKTVPCTGSVSEQTELEKAAGLLGKQSKTG